MKLHFGGTKINYILLITFLQLSSREVADVCLPCTAGGVGRQLLGIWHTHNPSPGTLSLALKYVGIMLIRLHTSLADLREKETAHSLPLPKNPT